MTRKHYDIDRIVRNAELLNDSQICESFMYGCDDLDALDQIETEIDELEALLPDGVNVLDLPNMFCGSNKTKVFGKATCSATNGHSIVNLDYRSGHIFESKDEAIKLGFRPCARCMRKEYAEWQGQLRHHNNIVQ